MMSPPAKQSSFFKYDPSTDLNAVSSNSPISPKSKDRVTFGSSPKHSENQSVAIKLKQMSPIKNQNLDSASIEGIIIKSNASPKNKAIIVR